MRCAVKIIPNNKSCSNSFQWLCHFFRMAHRDETTKCYLRQERAYPIIARSLLAGGVPLPLKHQSKQSWAKVPNHSRICWSLQIELSLSKPHFVTIYHSTKSQKAALNSIKVTQGLLGRQMDITNVCNVKNPCVPMRCAVKIIPNDNSIPMVVSHLLHGTPKWDNKVLPETT